VSTPSKSVAAMTLFMSPSWRRAIPEPQSSFMIPASPREAPERGSPSGPSSLERAMRLDKRADVPERELR